MCGIAGFFNSNKLSESTDALAKMLGTINYRGPDERGIFIDDFAALGHVRLSIIDLNSGIQPIHNEDETVWIAFNGEIYNYPEIRNELIQKGHRFTTSTDTEVLVHLYEEEGVDFLNRLNGQWAFALWDTTKKRLFCARDRVGIRPLYYTIHNGTLIFASEIKAIYTLPYISRSINTMALDQIFTFWTTLPGITFFNDVKELLPGHFLIADDNGIKSEKYWEIPLYPRGQWRDDTPDLLSDELQELLVDAVKIRLRADVPVGTYLSGGLDSSGITSIVANKFNHDVRTFGIRFSEDRFDEGAFQKEMVDYLGVQHNDITIDSQEIASSFLDAVWHCEKPLLRTAPVPLYQLSGLVRDSGIKVVLTGEGSDEFHGGYDIFKETLIRSFWGKQPDSKWRGKLLERLYPDIFQNDRTRRLTMSFFGKEREKFNDPLFSHQIRWNNTSRIKTFFSNEIQSQIGSYNCISELEQTLPKGFDTWHQLHRAQYLEISIFMSNYLLSSQGDRMAMANSIEVRMPFLDHRLMEYMGSVPSVYKICGLNEKFLLKKALAQFLPSTITRRVKHPYRAPIHKTLLAFADSPRGKDLFSESNVSEAGLFNVKKINSLIHKLSNAQFASETDSMALAGILSTMAIWHDFIKYSPAKPVDKEPDIVFDKRGARCIELL